ncbi:XRE family transcriptional regulator [Mycobacterium sp. E787]|nr:XRE family transcriptional regulator [Mycobacterium sp. E787]
MAMTDLAVLEREIMRSVSRKVHDRLRKAAAAEVSPEAFGDAEAIAEAMVAALPLGHVFDEVSGPFYDTAGLARWLGVSRQALHQKIARHALLACPLADGGVVYPVWQFLESGATIPSLGEVLTTLAQGTDDAWMMALWMRAPSDQLDGERPSEWLREGCDPERVIAMAREVAAGWRA